jgi:hypothetical protein
VSRGIKVSDGYFLTAAPMECFATKFPKKNYVIACGDADQTCTPDDIIYLANIIKKETQNYPKTGVIAGANHSVRPCDKEDVREAYLDLLFSGHQRT